MARRRGSRRRLGAVKEATDTFVAVLGLLVGVVALLDAPRRPTLLLVAAFSILLWMSSYELREVTASGIRAAFPRLRTSESENLVVVLALVSMLAMSLRPLSSVLK